MGKEDCNSGTRRPGPRTRPRVSIPAFGIPRLPSGRPGTDGHSVRAVLRLFAGLDFGSGFQRAWPCPCGKQVRFLRSRSSFAGPPAGPGPGLVNACAHRALPPGSLTSLVAAKQPAHPRSPPRFDRNVLRQQIRGRRPCGLWILCCKCLKLQRGAAPLPFHALGHQRPLPHGHSYRRL